MEDTLFERATAYARRTHWAALAAGGSATYPRAHLPPTTRCYRSRATSPHARAAPIMLPSGALHVAVAHPHGPPLARSLPTHQCWEGHLRHLSLACCSLYITAYQALPHVKHSSRQRTFSSRAHLPAARSRGHACRAMRACQRRKRARRGRQRQLFHLRRSTTATCLRCTLLLLMASPLSFLPLHFMADMPTRYPAQFCKILHFAAPCWRQHRLCTPPSERVPR